MPLESTSRALRPCDNECICTACVDKDIEDVKALLLQLAFVMGPEEVEKLLLAELRKRRH